MSKPSIHGRDHHPARSDPIKDMIVFNYRNVGGYLTIELTGDPENPDDNSRVVQIKLPENKELIILDSIDDPIVELFEGIALNFFIPSTTWNVDSFTINAVANARVFLQSGAYLEVVDSGNNQVLRVDEDGTLHMKAGASIVMDL